MASISDRLKEKLKDTLKDKVQDKIKDLATKEKGKGTIELSGGIKIDAGGIIGGCLSKGKFADVLNKTVGGSAGGLLGGVIGGALGGLLNKDSSKKKVDISHDKKILCKYQVAQLVFMVGADRIEMDHSNILSIEYLNDYEHNLMAMLKVTLRIDIRKKLWLLKNKKDIIAKFELNKIGRDTDNEKYVTAAETAWNIDASVYFSDEDEAIDVSAMESRIDLNEGKDYQSNNTEDENYFESQNTLDVYLVLPELIKGSRYSFNKVYTKSNLQNVIGQMLTESGHHHVLMSKIENDEKYEELLLPVNPVYKDLIYLDQYYGLYKAGALIYYDIDMLYILNLNGKLTAAKDKEWTETNIVVSKIANSTPGNGIVRKEGEKTFYVSISDGDINPQNFSVSKNASSGSDAKVVVTDTNDVEMHQADQSVSNGRNENVTFIKDQNKFTGSVMQARMEENECVLYINAENLDLNAFTPNKVFKVIFDEPSKQESYGKNDYRLAYSYHYLKLESEGYLSASHRVILKRAPLIKDTDPSQLDLSLNCNPKEILANLLTGGGIKGLINKELGNYEKRIGSALAGVVGKAASNIAKNAEGTLSNAISKTKWNDKLKKNITNKMSQAVSSKVDSYKNQLKSKGNIDKLIKR